MRFGADEAGRGPVLGPMVAAAVAADPDDLPADVADSKTLAPSRREVLATELAEDERIAIGIATIPTERIDEPSTDMNALTVDAQVDAIEHVFDDADVGVSSEGRWNGVVDACDVDPRRFADRVRDGLSVPVELDAEHRADATHPIVAAASIVAKVERDGLIESLDGEYPEHAIGSGYPSDPNTRSFLTEYVRENGDLPACARTSWQTSDDVLRAADQSELGEFRSGRIESGESSGPTGSG